MDDVNANARIDDDEQQGNDGAVKAVKVLSASDIFDVEDIKIVPVDVPEWGGMVYVRAMSAVTREKYIQSMRQIVGTGRDATVPTILEHGSGKLAALTGCEAQGELLFERNPETIKKVRGQSAKAMERVVDAAAEVNRLADEQQHAKATAKKDSAALPDTDAA